MVSTEDNLASHMIISPNQKEIDDHDVELLCSLAELEDNDMKTSRHNKPNKANMSILLHKVYVYTTVIMYL